MNGMLELVPSRRRRYNKAKQPLKPPVGIGSYFSSRAERNASPAPGAGVEQESPAGVYLPASYWVPFFYFYFFHVSGEDPLLLFYFLFL